MTERLFHINKDPDETEFGGESGPAGVGIRKVAGAGGGNFQPNEDSLRPADRMRLERLTGTHDPRYPRTRRVWNGEVIFRTAAQIEGDLREGTGNTGP